MPNPLNWRLPTAANRHVSIYLLLGISLLAFCGRASAGTAAGPAVRDVIEFTRIIQPVNRDNVALQNQVSPDGRHLFIVTRKADVGSDRNRFEVLLLDVSPERLASQQHSGPTCLVTVEAERDSDDANPALREARWADDRTIVFRARLRDQPFQVYRVDVDTRRMTQLTFEPLGLVEFAISKDLRRVVYVAPVSNPPLSPGARSLVVGTHSFWSVNFGQSSLLAQQRRYRYRTVEAGPGKTARDLGEPFFESSGRWPGVSVSPDGRWAVLPRYRADRQLAWSEQYPQIADTTSRYGPSLKLDPLGYYSRPYSYVPRQHVAYRLDDGSEHGMLDSPDDALPGGNQVRTDRIWMGGGTSVVIAGTHIPLPGGDPGRGRTAHIVEYWPGSGRWRDIALLNGRLTAALPVPGDRDSFVAIDGGKRRRFDRGDDGGWRETGEGGDPLLRDGWRLRIEEALNEPPEVVAVGPAGRSVRLTRLNPQFDPAGWGTMRPYAWKDARGRPWDGGLMVPANFDPGTRHSLVIQTYGFNPGRFYLDGSNLYDGYTSGFAGRAFLRENLLVLALPWGASSGGPDDEHGAIAAFSEGVSGAIDALVAEGLVARDRVGIMGWSATGERVLNLLTHTDAPIRAATLLDGDANTLFSMTITYAVKDGIQNRKESTNEGGPFGASLARWIDNDPSLHTDCVRAAVRIETYGPVVHNNWDIYALLRRQYKPVEMIVIPQGSHALSRPSERMISMQGNVDWYRFWLKDERRSEPSVPGETVAALRDQYARWSQMAALKKTVDGKPRCARGARVE